MNADQTAPQDPRVNADQSAPQDPRLDPHPEGDAPTRATEQELHPTAAPGGSALPGGVAADDAGTGRAPLSDAPSAPPASALTSQGAPEGGDSLARQLAAADQRWLERWMAGPTRTRWDRLPIQPGDPAPDVELVDAEAKPMRLSGLWSKGPGVTHLYFMRHYGCTCTRDRWEQLNEHLGSLRDAGATTVAIGAGEPERTRLFMTQRNISVPVLCDPQGLAYDAYGVLEGSVAAILHDTPWRPGDEAAGRAMADPRRDTDLRLVDNPWILPAEFIIDATGVVRFAHRAQYCEDSPPASVLLGAIRAAAPAVFTQ